MSRGLKIFLFIIIFLLFVIGIFSFCIYQYCQFFDKTYSQPYNEATTKYSKLDMENPKVFQKTFSQFIQEDMKTASAKKLSHKFIIESTPLKYEKDTERYNKAFTEYFQYDTNESATSLSSGWFFGGNILRSYNVVYNKSIPKPTGKLFLARANIFESTEYLDVQKNSQAALIHQLTYRLKLKPTQLKALNELVTDFKNRIDGFESLSRYEKIKLWHDYICQKVTYDYKYADNVEAGQLKKGYNFQDSQYGLLKSKKLICSGYSNAFLYGLRMFDIPVVNINGTVELGYHMYSLVKMGSKWYYIDVTWDDISSERGENKYKYFLKGLNYFKKTHKDDKKYLKNHIHRDILDKISRENFSY